MGNDLNLAGPSKAEQTAEAMRVLYAVRLRTLRDYCLANIAASPSTEYAQGMSDAHSQILRKLASMFPEDA